EATGGPVETLCDVGRPLGGTWGRDGVILFGRPTGGVSRISATGGEVTRVTTVDASRQEFVHYGPIFLADGRHFFYGITSEQKETRGIYLGALDGPLKRRLLADVTVVKYMAAGSGDTARGAGWLVFGRGGALLAQPFDSSRLEFTGEPFLLSDRVGSDPFYSIHFTFSVSDNGVLVFDPSISRRRCQYLWVDRRGQLIASLDVTTGNFTHKLSPDGKRFIADRVKIQTGNHDLWLYDASGDNATRFTFDQANNSSPVWAPDGSRIVWASN